MKNDDFRGGAICRTRKGATACVEVPSSVPALRVQVSSCFALIFWGYHGVFQGFDGLRRLWRESPISKLAALLSAAHPSGGPVAGGAIGTSGMPLTACGRERLP